jgi:uncharacterized protein (DUF2236 family)
MNRKERASGRFEQHREEARARLRASGIERPGPGSVSWKINRERLVIAGWGRAILLQIAHPLVAAAIDEHSSFRGSLKASLGRFFATVAAMLSVTFGDEEEAIAAAARINVIHDRVFGRLPASAGVFRAGVTYSARDASLLRWVHATLLDSIPLAYELLVAPLAADERERYCVEAAVMEPLLDIPAGSLPRNIGELDAQMRDMLDSGRIAVTHRSRALARAILFPPRWRLLWPLFRPIQLITIGLLPAPLRHAYGFEWSDRDARALTRWTTALKWVRRLTPPSVREWRVSRKRAGVRADPNAAPNASIEVLCDTK